MTGREELDDNDQIADDQDDDLVLPERLADSLQRAIAPHTELFLRQAREALTPALASIASMWTPQFKSIAKSVNAYLELSLAPYFDQLRETLKRFEPQLERDYPRNWWGIKNLESVPLETLVLEEGLPLAWVPERRVLELLLAAGGPRERRAIMQRNQRGIMRDCRRLLAAITSAEGRRAAAYVTEAIDAMEAGYPAAAQALSMNFIDTFGRAHIERWGHHTAKNGRPVVENLTMRDALVIGACWRSHANYRPGEPVPRTLSRHATAHGVGARQYTKINALLAVMHASALLKLLEVEAFASS
ncbi:hypothetical protein [Agromyces italicus]|uniref:hypothetical protein n=1 Tax=Agromyces italicus TaxID=279572 RepID=UPI0003B50608|nr:hypothetical protein [Agromyces italicus]